MSDLQTTPRLTATFTAPAMSCTSCVLRINTTLRQRRGISGVHIDLPSKTVRFAYHPDRVAIVDVFAALAEAGYPVTPTEDVHP